MKNFSIEPLKNWFGYTRRERRATSVLLLIIISVLILRYSVPEKNVLREINIANADTAGSVEKLPFNRAINSNKNSAAMSAIKGQKNNRTSEWDSGQEKRLVDINTCDSADLERLPGIGPVLSARIIKYRKLLGGFVKPGQLKEVYGLPPETFGLISSRIYADSSVVKKININTADYKQLIRFPYFEKYEVSAILKYRELKGRIMGIGDMTENKLISAETVGKVRPYLEFGE